MRWLGLVALSSFGHFTKALVLSLTTTPGPCFQWAQEYHRIFQKVRTFYQLFLGGRGGEGELGRAGTQDGQAST
jgi:hypothetical protein